MGPPIRHQFLSMRWRRIIKLLVRPLMLPPTTLHTCHIALRHTKYGRQTAGWFTHPTVKLGRFLSHQLTRCWQTLLPLHLHLGPRLLYTPTLSIQALRFHRPRTSLRYLNKQTMVMPGLPNNSRCYSSNSNSSSNGRRLNRGLHPLFPLFKPLLNLGPGQLIERQ